MSASAVAPTPTETLAGFFLGRTWDELPADQIAQMKRLLLDYIGVAVSGSQSASGRIAREFASESGGSAQASIIGQAGKVPALNAAFANAFSEHSIELDDVDEEALFHYGPPIVSAALATAQWKGSSGRELLRALLAGCEMMSRVSRATNNSLRDRGFHTTPTAGVFGATVAVGLLIGLTPAELTNALGLAGAQAAGLMEMYGPSMQKRFNPGPTARAAVTAARMAQLGFTGTDRILDGERGFGKAFAGGIDLDLLLEGLGEFIPVIVEHKAYSAARPIHNGVDCALEIRRDTGRGADEIADIVIRRHPDWAHYHLNAAPRTFHEAQVSLPYAVAVTFTHGAALPPQFARENLERADIQDLSSRIRIETDDSLRRGVSCDMTVTFRDGTTARSVVDYPKGSLQNPMSPAELETKFRSLTAGLLADDGITGVFAIVAGLENAAGIDELMSLLELGSAGS
jgi:2-methylcitrate dehydratase PrpD